MTDHAPLRDDSRAISPARPSASVILIRQAAFSFEVFMVRRPAGAAAFADVYVFPGGSVRSDDAAVKPGDEDFSPMEALSQLTVRGGNPPETASQAIALLRAALRELFEEAGVLLALDRDGQPLTLSDHTAGRFAEHRQTLQAGRASLTQLLRQEQLTPDYRALHYFSHWITPSHVSRRFDTRFFVARMPESQTALHCQIETTEGVWIRPDAALERAAEGRFAIVFPTRKHLERLSRHRTVEDLLTFAAQKPIATVQPEREPSDAEMVVLPPEVGECW